MNIVNSGDRYQIYGESVETFKTLPSATYGVGYHPQMGFWLTKHSDLETKEEVIYGDHARKATKILKSFENSRRNFGVILSGKKGIGKSLLARMLANQAIEKGLPVIIVDAAIPGITDFLSSITQEVVIIFDEFEKVFAKNGENGIDPQVELLSLFDGIDNGKKLFIITCNNPYELNEYLLNRPGRFHYHFEITFPTAEEIRSYMFDKLGDGYEDSIERVIKLGQIADITYDALRAISFELKQGYPLEETLSDLNINYEKGALFDIIIRLTNGWIITEYSQRIDIYSKENYRVRITKDKSDFIFEFMPSKIKVENGVLTVSDAEIRCCYDAFEGIMSEKDAEMARKQFDKTINVESVVLVKTNYSPVSKYLDI